MLMETIEVSYSNGRGAHIPKVNDNDDGTYNLR